MLDTSWGTFVSKLELKGKSYSCQIIKADRYFPSSQLCSNCGFQYKSLQLSERKWACPECGKTHIRDHNAAINLKNYIPAQHREFTPTDSENNFETCEGC
jgi:putative transposase